MNRGEAAEIIDALLAGYPWADWDELARATWMEAIIEVGPDRALAQKLSRTWARNHERLPSLAEFLAAIRPRQYQQADPDRPQVDNRVRQRMSELWRDALADVQRRAEGQRGADGHWHGGPEPCALCKGLAKSAPPAGGAAR